MAKSALADGSIKSEEKLRRTVRRYGELMGTAELEAHQKRGFKPNLLNFYTITLPLRRPQAGLRMPAA